MSFKVRKEIYDDLMRCMNPEIARRVFLILKKNGDEFTCNTNGVFFNLEEIKEISLYEIERIIENNEKINGRTRKYFNEN